ncbi:MAG: acyltransferase [bacterium]
MIKKFINYLRNIISSIKLKNKMKKFDSSGDNLSIDLNSTFIFPENIKLSDHIYIGPECLLEARGKIEIHENVIIGPKVTILTSNHRYENAEMLPYDDYYILKPVTIEKNVWIGANVSICPGVRVGEGAVIALGSVVTKDVPKYSIIGGNPAKILKMRDKEQYNRLNQNKMHYLRLKKEGKTSIKFISSPTFEDKVC